MPTLEFKHQLSRVFFEVRNRGQEDITLTDISVETITDGTLNVVNQTLTPGSTRKKLQVAMSAMELPKITYEFATVCHAADGKEILSSIMIFPQDDSNLILTLAKEDNVRLLYLPLNTSGMMMAAAACRVQITVYSLEEVAVTIALDSWSPDQWIDAD